MPEVVPAWLTGDKMETEAIFRERNFSFISRGLTSGCSREFILIRNYFKEGSFFAAPSVHAAAAEDLVLWDDWESGGVGDVTRLVA